MGQLRAGATSQDAPAAGGAPDMRAVVTDALVEFESDCTAPRISFVPSDMDEGSAVTSVARIWGVSHQLVSRLVHEASDMAEPGAPGRGTSCSTDPSAQYQ